MYPGGGDAIALGEDAGALMGAGDLDAGDGGGAGVGMDLQHGSDLPLSGLAQAFEPVAIRDNSMPHRIPTMFHDLTPSTTVAFSSPAPISRGITAGKEPNGWCIVGGDAGVVVVVVAGGQSADAFLVYARACGDLGEFVFGSYSACC